MPKKILVIEDDKFLSKMLSRALEAKGHEVILANDGKEGLNKAKTELPNLIVLDIMLPDSDGIEILKQLKADAKTVDIPVIVSTNLGDQATISRILDAGGKEYLVKADWGIDEVVKKIEGGLK
ncbi:MAG: response regulator [Patescibacteria group bacterium]|jgi:DNA-binding response OmpR family regulator